MCAYVSGEDKKAEVLATEGVRGTSAAHMAEDFNAQRELNPNLGRAVMHVALAWPAAEKEMSNELMLELTRAWMKEMKIDAQGTQWSLTRHNGTNHPHGHLIINRVDNQGLTISDQHNYRNSMEACRTLEKQYGLVNAKEAGQDNRRAKREQLPERAAARLYMQDSESRHKPHAASIEELLAAMKRDGINAQPTYQKGKLQAVVFEYQGHFVKGSELGRECSGNNLAKTIDAQRERVLGQRGVLSAIGQQYGQFGAELEAFGQAYAAQKEQAERDRKQAQEQQQKERVEQAAQQAAQQLAEKAARQAAQRTNEKADNQAPDPRPRIALPGPKLPEPTIERDGGIEM